MAIIIKKESQTVTEGGQTKIITPYLKLLSLSEKYPELKTLANEKPIDAIVSYAVSLILSTPAAKAALGGLALALQTFNVAYGLYKKGKKVVETTIFYVQLIADIIGAIFNPQNIAVFGQKIIQLIASFLNPALLNTRRGLLFYLLNLPLIPEEGSEEYIQAVNEVNEELANEAVQKSDTISAIIKDSDEVFTFEDTIREVLAEALLDFTGWFQIENDDRNYVYPEKQPSYEIYNPDGTFGLDTINGILLSNQQANFIDRSISYPASNGIDQAFQNIIDAPPFDLTDDAEKGKLIFIIDAISMYRFYHKEVVLPYPEQLEETAIKDFINNINNRIDALEDNVINLDAIFQGIVLSPEQFNEINSYIEGVRTLNNDALKQRIEEAIRRLIDKDKLKAGLRALLKKLEKKFNGPPVAYNEEELKRQIENYLNNFFIEAMRNFFLIESDHYAKALEIFGEISNSVVDAFVNNVYNVYKIPKTIDTGIDWSTIIDGYLPTFKTNFYPTNNDDFITLSDWAALDATGRKEYALDYILLSIENEKKLAKKLSSLFSLDTTELQDLFDNIDEKVLEVKTFYREKGREVLDEIIIEEDIVSTVNPREYNTDLVFSYLQDILENFKNLLYEAYEDAMFDKKTKFLGIADTINFFTNVLYFYHHLVYDEMKNYYDALENGGMDSLYNTDRDTFLTALDNHLSTNLTYNNDKLSKNINIFFNQMLFENLNRTILGVKSYYKEKVATQDNSIG